MSAKKIQLYTALFLCHHFKLHLHWFAVLIAWGFMGVLEGSLCVRLTHLDGWGFLNLHLGCWL